MRGPQRAVGSVLLRILALSTIHKQAAGFVHSPASVVGGCQVAVSRAALCTGRPAPLRRALHLHALAQPNTASNQKVVDVPVKAGTRLSPAIMGLSVVASLLTIKALLVLWSLSNPLWQLGDILDSVHGLKLMSLLMGSIASRSDAQNGLAVPPYLAEPCSLARRHWLAMWGKSAKSEARNRCRYCN